MAGDLKRVKQIFLAALEQPDSAHCAAFLGQACGGDEELRRRVEALLRQHEQASGFLESPPAGLAPNADSCQLNGGSATRRERPSAELIGSCIGPFKLMQKLGEGGMGDIYLAEQQQPVKRRVALKIIKAGMDSAHVIGRFEQERQALAMMDHPNIAKVLDAGATDSGRPYFVMELVKGIPITKYCDQERLTPNQRLELFIPVCQAVQHAHQKGIIHRDLKPSNVLIALYDGQPIPKVIDFGVAKATAKKLTDRTMFTEVGQIVGTLEYMAPEQAELNNLDIDTRADVYSLGVILYELLTGSPPFTAKQLRSAAFTETLRMIREVEPPRPSTKLSSSEELPAIAANRKLEPKRLTKLVHGDLDWIVMKCLEKERGRRYETANGLARDVQHYLADEPVTAGPPSATYRLKKFLRRNKRGLATVVVLGLMLLAAVGVVAGTIGWAARDRAARRSIVAEKVHLALRDAQTLGDKALTLVDDNPYHWEATLAQALAALHQAEGLAEPELESLDPATLERLAALKARLETDEKDRQFVAAFDKIRLESTVLKSAYVRSKGGDQYWKIRELFRDHGIELTGARPDVVMAWLQRRPEPIQRQMMVAMIVCLSEVPENARQAGDPLWAHLRALSSLDADPWRRRVLQALAASDWKTIENLMRDVAVEKHPPAFLVTVARAMPKEFGEASNALLRRIQRAHPGDYWVNLIYGMRLIAAESTQLDEGLRYLTAALALRPRSAHVHLGMGFALALKRQSNEALAEFRHAVALDPSLPVAHAVLGYYLNQKGDTAEAIAEVRIAIKLDPERPNSHDFLGDILLKNGNLDAAIAEYRLAVKLDPKDPMWRNSLGAALWQKDDLADAIAEFRQSLKLEPKNSTAHNGLRAALLKKGDLDEAIAEFQQAIQLDPKDATAHNGLGYVLQKKGDFEGAIAEYRLAIKLDPRYALAQLNLGTILCDEKHDYDGAVTAFRQAIVLDHKLTMAHGNLGVALRMKGDLPGAIAAYQRAAELEPANPWHWYQFAQARLTAGDREGYRKVCADMLNRFEKTRDAAVAATVLYTCLPVADALDDMARLAPLGELAATDKANARLLGAALYRAGQYEAAIEPLNQGQSRAWDHLFLAMAHQRLGRTEKAREYLKRAVEQIKTARYPWPESVESEQLRREAEAVLGI